MTATGNVRRPDHTYHPPQVWGYQYPKIDVCLGEVIRGNRTQKLISVYVLQIFFPDVIIIFVMKNSNNSDGCRTLQMKYGQNTFSQGPALCLTFSISHGALALTVLLSVFTPQRKPLSKSALCCCFEDYHSRQRMNSVQYPPISISRFWLKTSLP